MPAVTGHDYRVMRADRDYMSEVDIGLPLPPYFMAALRANITFALCDVVLCGGASLVMVLL
jgi:hypothetical protein